MSLGLSFGQRLGRNVLPPLSRIGSLSLDFTTERYQVMRSQKPFSDIITFTRASAATRFNHLGQLESVAANVPRIDYDPVTKSCRGLLIEEQRTNLLSRSEEFNSSAWAKTNVTVDQNVAIAPDGLLTADRVRASTTNQLQYLRSDIAGLTPGTYTYSFYVKRESVDRIYLESFQVNNSDYFDLFNGVAVTPAGSLYSMKGVGGGWFRCVATKTFSSAPVGVGSLFLNLYGPSVGDGTSGILIWGAQLELGAFPTSYIPTSGSQVTRAADVCSINTLSPWYNQSEGTLLVEASAFGVYGGPVWGTVVAIDDGTTSYANSTLLRIAANQYAATDNVAQSPSGSVVLNPSDFSLAMAMKSGDYAASIDGAIYPFSLAKPPANRLQLLIGRSHQATSGAVNAHIRKLRYYPKRLDNATLQALTA